MTDSLNSVRPLMSNDGETNSANKLTNTLGVGTLRIGRSLGRYPAYTEIKGNGLRTTGSNSECLSLRGLCSEVFDTLRFFHPKQFTMSRYYPVCNFKYFLSALSVLFWGFAKFFPQFIILFMFK